MANPCCIRCGKKLVQQTRLVRQERCDGADGFRVKAIYEKTGQYGPYRDGLFCSLTCGHRWAVSAWQALNRNKAK